MSRTRMSQRLPQKAAPAEARGQSELDMQSRVAGVTLLLEVKWTLQTLCPVRERPVRLSEVKRRSNSLKEGDYSSIALPKSRWPCYTQGGGPLSLHLEYQLAEELRQPLEDLLDHPAEWEGVIVHQSLL